MRILHVIDSLGLGGAERMLVDLANASLADGHQVTVCVTRGDVTLASELDPSVEILVLDRRKRFELSAARRLSRWITSQNVDVLHVHMRHTLAFVLTLRVLGFVRRPIVFHDHYGTIEVDRSTPLWFRVGAQLFEQYVGVYDKLSAWACSAGVRRERTTTIENAIDLRRLASPEPRSLRAELAIEPPIVVGLMVATVRPDKSLETLIDAVAQARHRHELRVAVAGAFTDPAYAAATRARIDRTATNDVITLLGARTDVPSLLASVDFAALSSRTESGPLVLIEYLAAGVPIVATAAGEIGRRLRDLQLPGIVEPDNPAAFAHALDALLELSAAERKARGRAGQELLDNAWDIRKVMPRWYAVYRAAIANPALNRPSIRWH